jgi:hypothetical protein
MRGPDFF